MKIKNISSKESWDLLSSKDNSFLIDVRTIPEWTYAGYPILTKIGKKIIMVSWQVYPSYELNEKFEAQVRNEINNKDDILMFICLSGGRSSMAANYMLNLGYSNCYNIIDGFEGRHDVNKQRGNIEGWKFNKLPWEQN